MAQGRGDLVKKHGYCGKLQHGNVGSITELRKTRKGAAFLRFI